MKLFLFCKLLIVIIVCLFATSHLEAADFEGSLTSPTPQVFVAPSGSQSQFNSNTYYNSSGQVTGGQSGNFKNIQGVGQWILYMINDIIIPLIMGLALMVFLFGILRFITHGAEDKAREQGRQFMLWGIVGLAVMVSVWGFVQILAGTIGESVSVPTLERLGR